jgi:hypothetical protein
MSSMASLATPTGQWPEAVHPRTRGGCMGDGQHIWAAAEWVLILRNSFVREEEEKLILCSGIPISWITEGKGAALGPALTSFGPVKILIKTKDGKIRIQWSGDWRNGKEPAIEIRLPGFAPVQVKPGENFVVIPRRDL